MILQQIAAPITYVIPVKEVSLEQVKEIACKNEAIKARLIVSIKQASTN